MSGAEERRRDGGRPLPFLPLHEPREAERLSSLTALGKGADLRRLYALEELLHGRGGRQEMEAAGPAGWHQVMHHFMAENPEAFSAGDAADACALLTSDSLAPRGAGRESAAREALRAMGMSKAAVAPRLFAELGDERARAEIMAYPLLVLPGCRNLTAGQREFLLAYDRAGGRIQAHGDFDPGSGLETGLRAGGRFLHTEDSPFPEVAMARFAAGFRQWIKPFRSFTLPQPLVDAHPGRSGSTLYLHLLNYNYDSSLDQVRPVDGFFMTIRGALRAKLLAPGQVSVPLDARAEGDSLRVSAGNLPLYALLQCETGEKAG